MNLAADKKGSGLLLSSDTQQPGVHILANEAGSSLRLANENGRQQLLEP